MEFGASEGCRQGRVRGWSLAPLLLYQIEGQDVFNISIHSARKPSHVGLPGTSLGSDIKPESPGASGPTGISPPLAPILMMIFWMLLGGAAGIKLTQSIWRVLGLSGEVSIAVPVGSVVGALVGALLGLITNPRLLVLLMAVFAGSTAGAVAGKLAWGDIGEIGGQVVGGLVGGAAWAVWLFLGGGRGHDL